MLHDPLPVDALRARLVEAGPLARLEAVTSTGSTNDDLADAAASWPTPGLLLADYQRGGHGRVGRTWAAPPGTAVLASMLMRPQVPVTTLGWLPLLAGLAVVRAVRRAGVDAVLKWPNDVLVTPAEGGRAEDLPGWGSLRKVAGILARVTPAGVVLGWGINVSQSEVQLPVETATSLTLAGARTDRAEILADVVETLCELLARWEAFDGDARAGGLADECVAVCATIGALVRVDLADARVLTGQAIGLADDAALVVRAGERRMVVHAGDVVHLRPRSA